VNLSLAAFDKSSRWSGCAMDINASLLSFNDNPNKLTAPYSVTTQ